MNAPEEEVRAQLFALQDTSYRAFQTKLILTVNPDTIIGVRTPALRKLAKGLFGTPEADAFLQVLPHPYYDENNLHGLLLERVKDYGLALSAVDAFLPYVDNWATCDLMSPKVFRKHRPELIFDIQRWMASGQTYIVRFGVEMLMTHYLDEDFSPEYPALVADLRSEEYYVNMMVAWYFATALYKQWDAAIPFLRENQLDRWTHNKVIQKAVESYRITDEQKQYLRTLRRK